MKKYELNGLGSEWIFEAESEEQAKKIYIGQLGFTTEEAYQEYMIELNGQPDEINFVEVE